MLGYGGMSTDETDTEGDRNTVKTLRRCDKPWRDLTISRMWEVIEEYDIMTRKTEKKERVGNPGLLRLPSMVTQPVSTSAPVRFLPKNFYRPTWWLSQHEHVQCDLLSKPERLLPDYSQYVLC
jgi:hypothetical protein